MISTFGVKNPLICGSPSLSESIDLANDLNSSSSSSKNPELSKPDALIELNFNLEELKPFFLSLLDTSSKPDYSFYDNLYFWVDWAQLANLCFIWFRNLIPGLSYSYPWSFSWSKDTELTENLLETLLLDCENSEFETEFCDLNDEIGSDRSSRDISFSKTGEREF